MNKFNKISNFMESSKNVLYCGLELVDNSEIIKLLDTYNLDSSWEIIAHHVTIRPFKSIPDNIKDREGDLFPIIATHIGKLGDKVIAVKVDIKVKTENEFPHITLAVNRKNGGKPVMSNNIKKWEKLNKKIKLVGKLKNFY